MRPRLRQTGQLRGSFGLSLGWGICWTSPLVAVKMIGPEAYSSCPNSSFASNALASCNLVSALGFMSMVNAAVRGRGTIMLLKGDLRFSSPDYTRMVPRMARMDTNASSTNSPATEWKTIYRPYRYFVQPQPELAGEIAFPRLAHIMIYASPTLPHVHLPTMTSRDGLTD